MAPHPLSILSERETLLAKEVLLSSHPQEVLVFREIFLQEPPKHELLKFLDQEHSGQNISQIIPPARLAKCQYDVIGRDKIPVYQESIIDISKKERVKHEIIGKEYHASLAL